MAGAEEVHHPLGSDRLREPVRGAADRRLLRGDRLEETASLREVAARGRGRAGLEHRVAGGAHGPRPVAQRGGDHPHPLAAGAPLDLVEEAGERLE